MLTREEVTALAQMIAVVTKRGAFEPQELVAVGSLYNRLVAVANAPEDAPAVAVEAEDA